MKETLKTYLVTISLDSYALKKITLELKKKKQKNGVD